MATELVDKMQNWLIDGGYATQEDVTHLGDAVLDTLPPWDSAMAHVVNDMFYTEYELEHMRQAVLVTAAQADANNDATKTWDLRARIAKSQWPPSDADQEALAAMLEEDIRKGTVRLPDAPVPLVPFPTAANPTPLPIPQPRSDLDVLRIKASKNEADRILAEIQNRNADADPGSLLTWPTNLRLQTALAKWLPASGLPNDLVEPVLVITNDSKNYVVEGAVGTFVPSLVALVGPDGLSLPVSPDEASKLTLFIPDDTGKIVQKKLNLETNPTPEGETEISYDDAKATYEGLSAILPDANQDAWVGQVFSDEDGKHYFIPSHPFPPNRTPGVPIVDFSGLAPTKVGASLSGTSPERVRVMRELMDRRAGQGASP